MPNQELHNNYSELISRYLSGNASDAEVQQLENWVLASAENKQQFINFKKAWMLSGMEKKIRPIDVDQLWQETSDQVFGSSRVVNINRKKSRFRWLGIAATIALLVAASIWIFQSLNDRPMMVNTTTEVNAFDLPDGSQITLNQASSLVYTPIGKDAQRKVALQGDAFFEVARDTAHPFIIQTEGLEIEVLGTSFYVDSRSSQSEIQVIVEEGVVAVRYDSLTETLQAGEKAVFQKATGELVKASNEDPNFQSIKTNFLDFTATKLEDVVFALERQFNIDITLNIEDTSQCELNTTFQERSLEFILTILKNSLSGIEVEQLEGEIVLSGPGCEQ